jgi:ATP-dependent Lon protease
MSRALLPADNREDWAELDKDIREAIPVDFAETAEEVFNLLFDKRIYKKQAGKKFAKKQESLKVYTRAFPIFFIIIPCILLL